MKTTQLNTIYKCTYHLPAHHDSTDCSLASSY